MKAQNLTHFKTQKGGSNSPNKFNLLSNKALHIYKHRCEETNLKHLKIPYLNRNQSTVRKLYSLEDIVLIMRWADADDIDVHS